jgi:hypothetical protein
MLFVMGLGGGLIIGRISGSSVLTLPRFQRVSFRR